MESLDRKRGSLESTVKKTMERKEQAWNKDVTFQEIVGGLTLSPAASRCVKKARVDWEEGQAVWEKAWGGMGSGQERSQILWNKTT